MILLTFHTRCNCSATDEKKSSMTWFPASLPPFFFFPVNHSLTREVWQPYLGKKSKCHCYALTSALHPALRRSSGSSNFRYHHKMQRLLLPCYAHDCLGQARYSYQLCIAISLLDISAASAALFSFWWPFQSYFSPVVICTAGDTFWLPPSVSFSL